MDKFVVTSLGLTTIAAIYWFFFGKKEETSMASSDTWTITVDGGYKPNVIKIPKDKAAVLTFIRRDANSCLEEIVFPDYKIKKYLPLNEPVVITLPAPHKTSGFHCGMSMFQGRIEVMERNLREFRGV